MTVSVTCFGGVGQIGGNKILVTDRDTKVLLDFGAGFAEGEDYFGSNITPRRVNGAGDYLEFGLVPRLPGLYSEDALKTCEGLRYQAPQIDAVLLSHYHSDHTGRIDLIDPKIPVYCGRTTALIHEAYSRSGGSPLDDHELRTFRTGDKFRVGSIEVEPVHVDHSIPGAYGFMLHTSEGTIAYTGDFRFHGPQGEMTDDFVARATQARPVLLLSEGTRVDDGPAKAEYGEAGVAEQTRRLLSRSKRLVLSSFRGNDFDRVVSFHAACSETGRRLVVSTKVAILLEGLRRDDKLKVPRLGEDVLVYIRRKGKGAYDDKDYYTWERDFLEDGVTAGDIRKKQSEFLVHMDQWYLPELIDIHPEPGGAYIHATTEAFNEEGERDEQVIRNWVEHYYFSYHQIHASGHAPMARVKALVAGIAARKLVPIHTERPDLFRGMSEGSKLVLVKKGEPVDI